MFEIPLMVEGFPKEYKEIWYKNTIKYSHMGWALYS